jgi:uncharacterized protein
VAGGDLAQERAIARGDRAPGVGAGAEARGQAVDAAGGIGEGGSAGRIDAERIFAEVKGIADTGFLVAFLRERDAHHQWACEVAENVTEPLLVCEAVLSEAAFHAGGVMPVMELLEDGMVRMAFEMGEHLGRLKELAQRFEDRSPDLADLCVIRMSEIYPKHVVITTDVKDFRVYRRGRREAIPILHP